MNRLLLTAIVTACLWGAYRGYALWINPLTQPPAAPPTLSVGPIPMPKNPEEFGVANRALRNEGWVKDATFKVRHAEDAYLFFDEYKSSDEKVELKPFAMVWRRSDRRESPYVIQCDSARITFERAFKLGGSESPGRIIAAVLDGKFQITGPSGLVIDGHDCKFSEQEHQLYSDHPIEFQYSPAQGALKLVRGSADKLQIDFTPSTYATHGRDMPRVGDVASLTLRRDVKLLFRHQDGESQTITRVTSAGPFVYDFLRRLATFQEQVHVARPRVNPDGSDGYDDIVAYWLALEFEEQPEDPNAESPSATVTGARSSTVDGLDDDVDEEPPSLGRLQLKYMRAMGQSGADPAIITSTPANFTGKMHDILYDALARRVVMKDEQEGVRLENGEVSLLTPEMQLEHDTQGELTFVSAVREGRLDFERPAADDHPAQKFHALWTRSLTLTPQPELQQTQIVLEGDARVIQPGEMGILCDRLTLDVDSDRLDAGRTEADPTSQKPVDAQPGVVPDALPLRHVLAEGQGGRVAMAGRQFQIETSRLDVTFKSGRLPKGRTGQPAAVTRRVRHSDRDAIELTLCSDSRPLVARRPMSAGSLLSASQQSFWSVPSEGAVPRILAAAPATPGIKSDDHWAIKAHSIEAIVLQDAASQETEIEQVVGEGEVHIRQTPPPRSSLAGPPADDQQPLVVTGHRMHLMNSGGFDQALHLLGSPAHLDRAGVYIEGDELFFDREVNTARVIGKGMMKSPVKQDLSGERTETPSQMVIHWLREMTFDGTVARYVESVRSRLDDSVMTCDEMTVTLNRRVDFSTDRPDTEGLGIQSVLCERGVTFTYLQWGEAQELLSRAEGRAGEFELRYDTGDFEARGGGKLDFWQQNEDSRVDVEPQRAAQANQPVEVDELPWQFTNVVFHGRIKGNIHKRHATLFDRVWVTHAPVERPLQVFTRDDLSSDTVSARNGVWMGCDELSISMHRWTGRDASYVQILGVGRLARVELEGHSFQANSDTLAYDESTKLFTLRGLGENPASVAFQDHPGAPYREQSSSQIQFNPGDRSGSIQKSRGVSGSF